jgi:hypothetical protein
MVTNLGTILLRQKKAQNIAQKLIGSAQCERSGVVAFVGSALHEELSELRRP